MAFQAGTNGGPQYGSELSAMVPVFKKLGGKPENASCINGLDLIAILWFKCGEFVTRRHDLVLMVGMSTASRSSPPFFFVHVSSKHHRVYTSSSL